LRGSWGNEAAPAMKKGHRSSILLIVALLLLVLLPAYISSSSYTIILISNILMYVVMAESWVIFSGPTGYISLAPAAFFGVGVYSSAILGEVLPLPVVILVGGIASFI